MDERELARLIEGSAAETRRHFDLVREELKSEIQLAGEGIAHLSERMDRQANDLRDEIKRGFVETQAMIKF